MKLPSGEALSRCLRGFSPTLFVGTIQKKEVTVSVIKSGTTFPEFPFWPFLHLKVITAQGTEFIDSRPAM